jgi:hypothetical protein
MVRKTLFCLPSRQDGAYIDGLNTREDHQSGQGISQPPWQTAAQSPPTLGPRILLSREQTPALTMSAVPEPDSSAGMPPQMSAARLAVPCPKKSEEISENFPFEFDIGKALADSGTLHEANTDGRKDHFGFEHQLITR